MTESNLLTVLLVTYALAGGSAIISLIVKRTWPVTLVAVLMACATVIAGCALVVRTITSGHAPLANHYETFLSLIFIATLTFVILLIAWRHRASITFLAILFPFALLILLQMYQAPSALAPVLRSVWLRIHVSVTIVSYALFLLSFGCALFYLLRSIRTKEDETQHALDAFAYRLIMVAHPLLLAGIVTGAIWANRTWGRYWGWDPKEVCALVTWLLYTLYLHIRLLRGVKGRTTAWVNVIAFLSVIFTYFGVNFFLGGLHSYAR